MSRKKKPPEDIELFRREMGDVRPLKFEKRVPSKARRTKIEDDFAKKSASNPRSEPSLRKSRCPVSPDKKVYETMKEAMSAADYVRQEWRREVRPYHCFYCGKYHLTSLEAD